MGMKYLTNCTESDGPSITAMCDAAKDITRTTFLKYADKESRLALEKELGYALHPKHGLTMAGDYHVQYGKSTYKGRPCVFICWSAIEWVFC